MWNFDIYEKSKFLMKKKSDEKKIDFNQIFNFWRKR